MNRKCRRTGVVVGRFQVPDLHHGHRDLIEFALGECAEVIIVLGVPRSYPTKRNPISAELRSAMIRESYPEVKVVELLDHRCDIAWSERLDRLVFGHSSKPEIVMYGSRDSFLGSYSGKFPTVAFEPKNSYNGTASRVKLASTLGTSGEFLKGIIYAQENRSPVVYPTVDIALMREGSGTVLLGRKPTDENKLRFIGGFVDPEDVTLEKAARREFREETSNCIEADDFQLVGSTQIDDWRYRGSGDTIVTTFFKAQHIYGSLKPGDDIEYLEWISIGQMMERLVDEHVVLGRMLIEWINR